VSPDRLGKPCPKPAFDETHGWTGKDREHWSSNYLGAFALLTGAHWAPPGTRQRGAALPRRPDHRSGLFDLERRCPARRRPHGSWPRAGCCSRPATRRCAAHDERIDHVYFPQWAGRDARPPTSVRTMSRLRPRRAPAAGQAADYWNPWQDAIAAVGFGAVHRVTGNPRARELAEALAMNVVRYGWLDRPRRQHHRHRPALAGRPTADSKPSRTSWTPTFAALVLRHRASRNGPSAPARSRAIAALRTGDEPTSPNAPPSIQQRVRASRAIPPEEFP
jgi:hypothetical protein